MQKKFYARTFILFGIGGIIAYITSSKIPTLLLGLVFIIIGIYLFVKYMNGNKNKKE